MFRVRVSQVVTVGLLATVVVWQAPLIAQAPGGKPPVDVGVVSDRGAPDAKPVVRTVVPGPDGGVSAERAVPSVLPAAKAIVTPVPATESIDVTGPAKSVGVVRLGRPKDPKLLGTAKKLTVEVLDQDKVKSLGGSFVAFKVARSDGATGKSTVSVDIDTSGFADSAGTDFLARLQVVRYPACALTTPAVEECHAFDPVASATDFATKHVAAEITVGDGADAADADVARRVIRTKTGKDTPPPSTTTTPDTSTTTSSAPSSTTTTTPSATSTSTVPVSTTSLVATSTTTVAATTSTVPRSAPTVPPTTVAAASGTVIAAPAVGRMGFAARGLTRVGGGGFGRFMVPGFGVPVFGVRAQTGAGSQWLYGLATKPSGATGSYQAAVLAGSGSASVNPNTGGFSWSYPIVTPPGPVGAAPRVSLDYSSQAVDAMTTRTTPQTSIAGLGWSLSTDAWIERQYWDCKKQGLSNNPAVPWAQWYPGSMCLHVDPVGSDNDTTRIVMNGHSSRLLRDTALGAGMYRLEHDPGWRIQRVLSGANNGDYEQTYWIVWTPDGTKYTFGLTPQSTFTMPVGSTDGAACYTPNGSCNYPSDFRYRAWKWNLEQIIDPRGNVTAFTYVKEQSRYSLNGTGVIPLEYTRSGYLGFITWGGNTTNAANATNLVTFGTTLRCVNWSTGCPDPATTYDFGIYPDVPLDLLSNCQVPAAGGTCYVGTPTFYSTQRLSFIQTSVWAGVAWRQIDYYSLLQSFPTGTNIVPRLYLLQLQRQAFDAAGASIMFPAVRFDSAGSFLPNRADTALASTVPPTLLPRVDQVQDELGGVTRVAYGQAHPCNITTLANLPVWSSNATDCFDSNADWYTFGGAKGVFNRYLVTQLKRQDLVAGSGQPDVVTSYSYEGLPAWAFERDTWGDPADSDWTDWRGYATVLVTTGTGPTTERTRYQYFRGMNGDNNGAGGTKSVTTPTSTVGTRSRMTGGSRASPPINGPTRPTTAARTGFAARTRRSAMPARTASRQAWCYRPGPTMKFPARRIGHEPCTTRTGNHKPSTTTVTSSSQATICVPRSPMPRIRGLGCWTGHRELRRTPVGVAARSSRRKRSRTTAELSAAHHRVGL